MNVITNAMRNLFKGVINDYFPFPIFYFPFPIPHPIAIWSPFPIKIHRLNIPNEFLNSRDNRQHILI